MIDDFRSVSRRFFLVLRSFFSSEVRWKALGWSGTLLVVLLSINGLNVLNSYVGRDFMTAVSDSNPRGYRLYAILYLCVFIGSTIAAVFSRFSEERLRLLWRTWLTEALMDRYLDEHAYLRLGAVKEVDNPDQRITEDVKAYTQTTLSFFLLSLNASITSVAFLGVLWSITPWLVAAALAYATVGTLATIGLGRPLVRLDNRQLTLEADLRYALIRVRECAETIAVMGIEGTMRAKLRALLADLVKNNQAIIAVSRNLGFVTNGYNYLLQLVPLLIVAPLYMRGQVEFGVVTQSAMAFAQVLGAFSLIVTQFETLSSFAAVSGRLHTITTALDDARKPLASSIEVVDRGDAVAFDHLTLRAPNRRAPLIKDLSLTIDEGENLFVTGPDGHARTSLFLATAGVRQEGEGRIERPGRGELMLAPRRLFAPRSTLREQFLLRIQAEPPDDAEILSVARAVGLGPALTRAGGLDSVQDWSNVLAPGDQSRLILASILLGRPRFVFLDRVADSLEPDQVDAFYRQLAEASITYLSVGEGDFARYHDQALTIHDDGTWQLMAVDRVPSS